MSVDLRTCESGDLLIDKQGNILRYLSREGLYGYPHVVKYQGGLIGTRLDNGRVFNYAYSDTGDIVKIIHAYYSNKQTRD